MGLGFGLERAVLAVLWRPESKQAHLVRGRG